MGLGSVFRTLATTSSHYFAKSGEISLVRVGQAATPAPGVAYSEERQWRRGSRNERQEFYTRELRLDPGTEPIPIGSTFTVESMTYTVVSTRVSTASGSLIVTGERHAAVADSRSDGWN